MKVRLTLAGHWAAGLAAACSFIALVGNEVAACWLAGAGLGLFVISGLVGLALRSVHVGAPRGLYLTEGERRDLDMGLRTGGWLPIAAVDVALHAPGVRGVASVLDLPRRSVTTLPLNLRAVRRGAVTEARIRLRTQAPFGLLEFERTTEVELEGLVLPRARRLRSAVVLEAIVPSPSQALRAAAGQPGEEEFYALRDWRPGDPETRVHPLVSARRARKVLRVFRGDVPPRLELVFDPRVTAVGAVSGTRRLDEAARFAAGLLQLALRRGIPVALWQVTEESTTLVQDATTTRLGPYSRALALVPRLRPSPCLAPSLPASPSPGSRWVLIHLDSDAPADHHCLSVRVGSTQYESWVDATGGARHGG